MVEGAGFGCMPEHSGSCRDEIGSGIQDGSHYVTWQCEPVAERHYLLPQHPHKCSTVNGVFPSARLLTNT